MDEEQRARHQTMACSTGIPYCQYHSHSCSIHTRCDLYHTSILTGEAWVIELLTGHPEHIRCELGVHRHVFIALISELCELGLQNSRLVSLEEKLSIFLYCCVTGLTI
jgi:hypothetical protein